LKFDLTVTYKKQYNSIIAVD